MSSQIRSLLINYDEMGFIIQGGIEVENTENKVKPVYNDLGGAKCPKCMNATLMSGDLCCNKCFTDFMEPVTLVKRSNRETMLGKKADAANHGPIALAKLAQDEKLKYIADERKQKSEPWINDFVEFLQGGVALIVVVLVISALYDLLGKPLRNISDNITGESARRDRYQSEVNALIIAKADCEAHSMFWDNVNRRCLQY